ncbi:phage antirepressor N-terminal domain-containing protein [Xenorhabdus ishibashii]|uniref:Antirepressor n=1 Tax=Xenorhabdus ishibashii TaxID=1034471 RepID=A0A2D0KCI5_9GAMM|nr:phage antirepressor N-terminal domain-containing protein [Xenorhabdus ishibashii]PHM61169.1 antirepressor [Xenorhabdus ishibashii]
MSIIATKEVSKTINVPFYGADLYVVNYNGEPYVPMKPIVDGMGLAWEPQLRKLNQRFAKGMIKMVIPSLGGAQETVCLAFRKLAAWLSSISPNKVKASIREKVIRYQEECDDVLYEYWTTGEVKAKKTSTQDRTPLRGLVNTLMGKYGISDRTLFQMVHREFGVNHIDELSHDQLPSAIAYLATKVIEGEFLGREELPIPQQIDLSLELRNANALYRNLMHLKDTWDTLNPHLSVLAPDIAQEFNGAFSNVSGPILILKNGLERKVSLLN